jgi:hypothetical protein
MVKVRTLAATLLAMSMLAGAAPRPLSSLCPPSFKVRLPCGTVKYRGIAFQYYACSGASNGKVVHRQSASCLAGRHKIACAYSGNTGLWGSTSRC